MTIPRSRLHEVARVRITAAESSTASDHRKTVGPRGVIRLSQRMLDATEKVRMGATLADVAKLYGVSPQTVSQWGTKVRAAAEDAASLGDANRP